MPQNLKAEPKFNPEEIVRYLLDATKTRQPPTDEIKVATHLNLRVETFRNADKYNLPASVRAFIAPNQRLIGVHEKLTPKQKKYSVLHEVGHFILPGHATHPKLIGESGIIEDTSKSLSTGSIIQLEIEANQFAADMIFQLERFDARVKSHKLEWENIIEAAEVYNASFEATARRWVEKSLIPCALIVFNPVNRNTPASPLELIYTITSKPFRQNYFDRLVPGIKMDFDTPIFKHFYSYRDTTPTETITVDTTSGESKTFDMQLFSNTYREFALITP